MTSLQTPKPSKRSICIDRVPLLVDAHEFEQDTERNASYSTLKIYKDVDKVHRLRGLLKELLLTFFTGDSSGKLFLGREDRERYGGYIAKRLDEYVAPTHLVCEDDGMRVAFQSKPIGYPAEVGSAPFILTSHLGVHDAYSVFKWKEYGLGLFVHSSFLDRFKHEFRFFIKDDSETGTFELVYENLLHYVMIIKNGGDQLRDTLEKNRPFMDRWTILDTGSTDNTMDIIREVLGETVKGHLFQEPFVDFGTSRNRALDLAGDVCTYATMLDDTYILQGDLRPFLKDTRGDQFSDSYSLYIQSDDVQYASNRIVRTDRNVRYLFKIHEVLQEENNKNVMIPAEVANVLDKKDEYMNTRTMDRKQFDLDLLFQSVQEDPQCPRHLYYIAQTYNCMGNKEKAYKYFLHRLFHPVEGFVQERLDAAFEAARLAHFTFKKDWKWVETLYLMSWEMDKTRPDALYFIGLHYLLDDKNSRKAFKYLKQAFELGYPINSQYSLKPTLSFHFVPKFLTMLCYELGEHALGEKAAKLFLEKNNTASIDYSTVQSWHAVFQKLNMLPPYPKTIIQSSKRILTIVADGGFDKWSGSDLDVKGMGGSETHTVEMARWLQASGVFDVYVFCNCENVEIWNQVQFRPIDQYFKFIRTYFVHTSIISRFSEYIPATIKSTVENIYMFVHDLTTSGTVLTDHPKIKKIFCLTDYHRQFFTEYFSNGSICKKVDYLHYGIDHSLFPKEVEQVPHRFIYSSFANRGLSVVLEMWDKILARVPDATLDIFCDTEHPWVKSNCPEEYALVQDQIKRWKGHPSIQVYGWVNKKTLYKHWQMAQFWLYPCLFKETFCMTALEAAASKTLVISNGLASLKDTVGDRGITVIGEPKGSEWQNIAVDAIVKVLEEPELATALVEKNYQWAREHSWEAQARKLLSHLEPDALTYVGMYNWVHDLPPGTAEPMKNIIVNTVGNRPSPRILELGTWSGTALVEFLRILPNSTAVAVDLWTAYTEDYQSDTSSISTNIDVFNVEEAFYKNLERAGVRDRVEALKMDKNQALVQMCQNGSAFDFVYLDVSKDCMNIYFDLVMSLQLLTPGGLIVVDDYLYEHTEYDLCPKIGVDKFIEQFSNAVQVIRKDYRCFLKKL